MRAIRPSAPRGGDEAPRSWFNPDKNHLFERISYHETAVEAIDGTDALYISTDWEEFRGLARTIQATARPPYLVMDGRRMLPDFDMLVTAGYDYLPVGGPLLHGRPASDAPYGENGSAAAPIAELRHAPA